MLSVPLATYVFQEREREVLSFLHQLFYMRLPLSFVIYLMEPVAVSSFGTVFKHKLTQFEQVPEECPLNSYN